MDDLHVGARLVRIAFKSGAQRSEGVSALEKMFGPLKVKACWAAWVGAITEVLKIYHDNVIH